MKIILEREKCIGCGACAAICSKHWELKDDGKTDLIGSNLNSEGNYEKEITDIECNQEASEGCPVNCIKIIK
ncbi:MAG: ferredoxin [Candidatus Pacebacteria bacterium]|nr:ferredoxin [Candidatus Paceibacterota bacterium]